MKSIALIALLVISSPLLASSFISSTRKPSDRSADTLPNEWFWNDVDGISYLTTVRNHHYPQYCGGCYAFATTSTLSDRIKIARNAAWPDINIAPQVVLSCTPNNGCHGGSQSKVYEYVKNYGITDETCSAYIAKGHENGAPCTDEIKCNVCDADGNCEVPESYPVYYVEDYGRVSGESDMMREIYDHGPISCMLSADPIDNYTSGIAEFFQDSWSFDHIISVVGFGDDDDGTPYWLVRNSWGTFWGEDGFFRVGRGNNSLGIESSCYWVDVQDTWTNDVRNYTTKATEEEEDDGFLNVVSTDTIHESCIKLDPKFDGFTSLSGSSPIDTVSIEDIPSTWDWRDANGVNFLSWSKAENQPNHCAACWVQSATSALADRIMIARNSTFPHMAISAQVLLNCGAGGDCTGGDPLAVFEFAYEQGIPEDTCQPYLGKVRENATCSGEFLCLNCQPPAPSKPNSVDPHNCLVVEDFRRWKVSDYGRLSGVEDMKKSIFTEGPIVCTMQITSSFEQYQTGVFSQSDDTVDTVAPYHAVSVVGWTVDDSGVEQWIVRNNWGTYWGEHGYFRIQVGQDNLGIENNCYWASPIVHDYHESRYNVVDFESVFGATKYPLN